MIHKITIAFDFFLLEQSMKEVNSFTLVTMHQGSYKQLLHVVLLKLLSWYARLK